MQCHSILVQDLSQLQAEVLQFPSNQSVQHLIQVFSTQSSDLVVEYSRLLQQRFPNATILGHSTSHCIKNGDIVSLGTLVVVTELDETRLSACVIPYTGDQSRDGEALIEQLQITEETKAVICFAEQVDDK
jgi:hypothetical protein